jgi:enoyl-[acyl-carrier protein] reductase III
MTASGDELFSLRNKTVLVTGGTRGIGYAISLRFARSGATVIANYLRDEKSAHNLQTIAAEEGLAVRLCRADLTSEKGLEQLERSLQEGNVQLAGLVHCAATGIHRPLEELTERHFDWTFNLNVRVFFKLIKLLLPRLSKGSSVVAVSSWGALRALPSYSLVGASKGGLEALILTAGAVLTDAWKAMPNSEARLLETVRRTPAGRLATAEEVAYGAQFLCSEAAAGMIGHTLVIDGGIGIVA